MKKAHADLDPRFQMWLRTLADGLPRDVRREIEEDVALELAPWTARGGIRPEDVERGTAGKDIVTGSLNERRLSLGLPSAGTDGWHGRALEETRAMLTRLVALIPSDLPIPDFAFAINLGDYPVPGAAVLSPWAREGDLNPRFPYSTHWAPHDGAPVRDTDVRVSRTYRPEALSQPWQGREPRVVWRGTATGMYDHHFRWARLAARFRLPSRPVPGRGRVRLDLCRIAAAHPDVIDAAIVGWQQISEDVRRLVEPHYRTAPRTEPSWFLRHRFVLNVDGNVAASSFHDLLTSGSCVLRQDTPWLDFCSRRLRRGVHFVGFRRDLSDVVDVSRWALAHDDECREIAARARDFALRRFTGVAVDYYALALLAGYAGLYRNRGA